MVQTTMRPRRNSTLKPQSPSLTSSSSPIGSYETISTSLSDLFKNQSIKQIKAIKEKSEYVLKNQLLDKLIILHIVRK